MTVAVFVVAAVLLAAVANEGVHRLRGWQRARRAGRRKGYVRLSAGAPLEPEGGDDG